MPATIGSEYAQFLVDLASRIRQLREERGWSLRDMTVKHDYAESHWRRYERSGAVNLQSLLRIAMVFQISLSQLLDGLGEFPAKSLDEIKREMCDTKSAGAKSKAKGGSKKAPSSAATRNKTSLGEDRAKAKSVLRSPV